TRGTTGTHLGNHNCKQLSFSGLAQVRCCNANLKTTFSSQKNEYDQELTRVEATLGMRGAGASLLTSTPPGPGEHSWSTARKRKEQPTKETADFRQGQGNGKRGSEVSDTCCRCETLLRTDDRQHRHNEQN